MRRPILILAAIAAITGIDFWVFSWADTSAARDREIAVSDLIGDWRVPGRGKESDCSARCLYIICRLHGRKVRFEDLRKSLRITDTGVSMLELKEAAGKLGFTVEGRLLSRTELVGALRDKRRVGILHCKPGHFVVAAICQSESDEDIVVLDPADRGQLLPPMVLGNKEYGWDGVALIVQAPSGDE
jgi:ABC-type bacteriocin/lantibiotic exporter with double-glycine peptidase domain